MTLTAIAAHPLAFSSNNTPGALETNCNARELAILLRGMAEAAKESDPLLKESKIDEVRTIVLSMQQTRLYKAETEKFRRSDLPGRIRSPNAAFIRRAKNPHPGDIFVSMPILALREINNVDKERATSLATIFRKFFWEEFELSESLKGKLVAKYDGFKNLELIFESSRPTEIAEINRHLLITFIKANDRFNQIIEPVRSHYSSLNGIAGEPLAWHSLGIATTRTQANIEAREARDDFRPGQTQALRPRTFTSASQDRIRENLAAMNKNITLLQSNPKLEELGILKAHPDLVRLFIKNPTEAELNDPLISVDAAELIRNIKPKLPTLDAYVAELQERFDARFGYRPTRHEAIAIRDISRTQDKYSIDSLHKRRTEIDLSDATFGLIGSDFARQGARNFVYTLTALRAAKRSWKNALEFAELAERASTIEMLHRKRYFRHIVKEVFGIPMRDIRFSGDDGIAFLHSQMTEAQKLAYIRRLILDPKRPGLERDYRLVFVPRGAEDIRLMKFAEDVEKRVRVLLEREIGREMEREIAREMAREIAREMVSHINLGINLSVKMGQEMKANILVLDNNPNAPPDLVAKIERALLQTFQERPELGHYFQPGTVELVAHQ